MDIDSEKACEETGEELLLVEHFRLGKFRSDQNNNNIAELTV